ncbi:MAG: Response regulator receiver [Clostridia bacterium 62_21]|nr:MAG: Response regulator receiver [Clostridia bacterium 62_21]
MDMAKILVVDDDQHILDLLTYALEREKHAVFTVRSGNEVFARALSVKPDLIILDLMLPGEDGYTICRALRADERTRLIPVIILSARGEEFDRVLGLELGADDYVIKPFSVRELVARVRAHLRRKDLTLDKRTQLTVGSLTIDGERLTVSVGDVRQELTPREFELLWYLARHPGKVFSREYLLERIWGYDFAGDSRTVDVHIRHIRRKIEQLPGAPKCIDTVRGVGYRFRELEA